MTDTTAADAWSHLLESEESRNELVLQHFLEAHPSYVPGARTLDTNSGHDPWPHAVISQSALPGLSTKFPDFMWIANDSTFLYPVLIEIETPWKRWFQNNKLTVHSDLTAASTQVAQWRQWFSSRNCVAFYDHYRIPRALQDLTLRPRFVVVHGRRREANASPAALGLRGALTVSDDTRLVTFDHLHDDPAGGQYFTVSVDEHGYKIHPRSPSTTGLTLPDDVLNEVAGLPISDEPQPRPGYWFRPPRPDQSYAF